MSYCGPDQHQSLDQGLGTKVVVFLYKNIYLNFSFSAQPYGLPGLLRAQQRNHQEFYGLQLNNNSTVFKYILLHLKPKCPSQLLLICIYILCVCFAGFTQHPQCRDGDWDRAHRGESPQEEHQSLWTHHAALHPLLRHAQVILTEW